VNNSQKLLCFGMIRMPSNLFKNSEKNKRELKILILGPYKPLESKKRLFEFRDCLNLHGFHNAKVVEDFSNIPKFDDDPDINFTLKSRDKIQYWSEVLIFVFIRDANNLGVWSELQFTISHVKEKIRDSIELHEKGVDLSTQTRGPLKISRMYSNEFRDPVQLCKLAQAFCANVAFEKLWT